jgi:hypothetical protein
VLGLCLVFETCSCLNKSLSETADTLRSKILKFDLTQVRIRLHFANN